MRKINDEAVDMLVMAQVAKVVRKIKWMGYSSRSVMCIFLAAVEAEYPDFEIAVDGEEMTVSGDQDVH